MERRLNVIILLLTIAPILIQLAVVHALSVNVVYIDQWVFVNTLEKASHTPLTFSDILAPHNEHRIAFPRLVMLLLARYTRYDTTAETFIIWVLNLITILLVRDMYLRDFGRSPRALMCFIPVVWLMFSLRAWENILFGFQIVYALYLLGFVIAVHALGKKRYRTQDILQAVCGGVLTSFSLGTGLLVWPIGLGLILLSRDGARWRPVALWSLAGVLVLYLYLSGWGGPSGSSEYVMKHPVLALEYLLVYLGMPFGVDRASSLLAGGFLFSLAYIVVKEVARCGRLREDGQWVALVVMSMSVAVLTTVSRAGLGWGVQHALWSPRYVGLSAPGIVGTYLLALRLGGYQKRKYRGLMKVTTAIVLFGLVVAYTAGLDGVLKYNDKLTRGRHALLDYRQANDTEMRHLFPPNPQLVRDNAPFLEEHGLNVFRPTGGDE